MFLKNTYEGVLWIPSKWKILINTLKVTALNSFQPYFIIFVPHISTDPIVLDRMTSWKNCINVLSLLVLYIISFLSEDFAVFMFNFFAFFI